MADPSSPYPEVPTEVFERMRHRIEAAFMGALAAEPDAPAWIDAVIIDTFRAGRAQAAADIRAIAEELLAAKPHDATEEAATIASYLRFVGGALVQATQSDAG